MNEAPARRRWRRRRAQRRSLEQQLARVSTQIEGTDQYQSSLQRVLALGDEFQRGLDGPQRERWLALEDALLEHTERLNRAYFEAGVSIGQGSHSERRGSNARLDAVLTLARLLIELARR